MSDTAPTMHVTTRPPDFLELAGAYALSLLPRPRPKLTIIAGGVRPLGERSARPVTLDLKIIQKETN